MRVNFIDLPKQYESIKKPINKAVLDVIAGGNFILGENVIALEKLMANLVGSRFAVGVNSGTDALLLSLKALGVSAGDEVITSPFSFISTAEIIAQCGATPVFVDIDPKTFNVDPSKIERLITKKTKVIMPVHLYGQMADMGPIMRFSRKYKLFVIEDAAQAIGAQQKISGKWYAAGNVGTTGCFSFFPTKNLGGYGDGGMVTTNNKALFQKLSMMRNHGSKEKYRHEFLGVSSRLDEIQAAVLIVKLSLLKTWNDARQRNAQRYTEEFGKIKKIVAPFVSKINKHVFHQYTLRTTRRNELRRFLGAREISTAIHYPTPLHLQPSLKYLNYRNGDLPHAERAAQEVVSLPISPELTRAEREYAISSIKDFFKE